MNFRKLQKIYGDGRGYTSVRAWVQTARMHVKLSVREQVCTHSQCPWAGGEGDGGWGEPEGLQAS